MSWIHKKDIIYDMNDIKCGKEKSKCRVFVCN